MNRKRLKGEAAAVAGGAGAVGGVAGGAKGGSSRDCKEALSTLTAVLLAITKLMVSSWVLIVFL